MGACADGRSVEPLRIVIVESEVMRIFLRRFWRCLVLCGVLIAPATAASGAEKMTLRVLSYNVNDLPWPLRKKAKSQMKFIGRDLARRRAEGTAPDIVLLQEAFTNRSKKLVKKAGYPYVKRARPAQVGRRSRRGGGTSEDRVCRRQSGLRLQGLCRQRPLCLEPLSDRRHQIPDVRPQVLGQ